MEKQTAKVKWMDSVEHDLYGDADITLKGDGYATDWEGDSIYQKFEIGGIPWSTVAYLGEIADPRLSIAEIKEACCDEVRMTGGEMTREEMEDKHDLDREEAYRPFAWEKA